MGECDSSVKRFGWTKMTGKALNKFSPFLPCTRYAAALGRQPECANYLVVLCIYFAIDEVSAIERV